MRSLNTVYERANEDRYTQQSFRTGTSTFHTSLRIPEHVEGRCLVRVFLRDRESCALGAASLRVDRRSVANRASTAEPPSKVR